MIGLFVTLRRGFGSNDSGRLSLPVLGGERCGHIA